MGEVVITHLVLLVGHLVLGTTHPLPLVTPQDLLATLPHLPMYMILARLLDPMGPLPLHPHTTHPSLITMRLLVKLCTQGTQHTPTNNPDPRLEPTHLPCHLIMGGNQR